MRINETRDVLKRVLAEKQHGEIAVVSSFGAESAVLLHLVAEVDPATPVIFIDTRMLFEETLAYKDQLIRTLGLTDVRTVSPDGKVIRQNDPYGRMHLSEPDACCGFRKTEVLRNALAPFDGWITGRKRFQAATRDTVETFEQASDGKLKVNPLAHWTKEDIDAYFERFDLPPHPLVEHGYLSIGCASCTSAVKPGEDVRAGRWRGSDKTECGIHFENGKLVRGSGANTSE
ncbi:phosphoadenylyl-sulfate reductase [Oricola cellulosilytica]|uniref:Adenosine 5'-phosphosulfate reductase n=1 Tax=Oricola cellulosilytica TaxID=1429082 RepID=A0A4R0P8Z4_9HYPH|nr:phosphoadenylyl-sulfate reductase [Oricola cellulosilytica]